MKKTLLLLVLAVMFFSCEESEYIELNKTDVLIKNEWVVEKVTINGIEQIHQLLWTDVYLFTPNGKILADMTEVGTYEGEKIIFYNDEYTILYLDEISFSMTSYKGETYWTIYFKIKQQ